MKWFYGLFCLLVAIGCQQAEDPIDGFHLPYLALMEAPVGFPEMPTPPDNTFSAERWALGKRMFFDPVLSLDSSVSCASCHNPSLAFSDQLPTSPGVAQRPGTRNSPPLANIGYHPYFTREGGVPTLEMQVLIPIQEHNEFAFNIVLLTERLAKDTSYTNQALRAYDRPIDPFVITRSLACFERSLISGTSTYDAYVHYENDEALTESQLRGMELFFSEKTHCSRCHGGFNFTEYAFENNGLYDEYTDLGRFRLTLDPQDRALFKVPSLRNIALTSPYMHDGSIADLEAVVAHYVSGGKNNPEKNPLIQPLNLTLKERRDLIQFLHTLTDVRFVENTNFRP